MKDKNRKAMFSKSFKTVQDHRIFKNNELTRLGYLQTDLDNKYMDSKLNRNQYLKLRDHVDVLFDYYKKIDNKKKSNNC